MIHLLPIAVVLSFFLLWKRSKRHYPPGPKRLPFLGNLFDIPRAHAYKKFADYSKALGSDIIYLNVAGVPFIILNSLEASIDILEKRSNIYSSRFHSTMSYELIEGRRFFALSPYNDEWREGRRLMVKYLSTDQTHVLSHTRHFIRGSLLPNFLNVPEDFLTHVRNGVGGSILSLTYGLPMKRVNDPWIALAEEGLQCLTSAAVPGKYAVDVIGFLKYLPEWFPGAKFQREAREGRRIMRHFFRHPFETAKKGMTNGTVQSSFVSESLDSEELDDYPDKEYREKTIENVAGTFTAGGTDTTVTAVKTLIAVLLLHPDVQAKAQAEIDAVIGTSRLPDLEDKPKLPYLNAVMKEALRWRPALPTGMPHMSTEDDTYRGYFIPKGSIVMGNTWAIMHDEKVFPDPSRFDPTRFLTPSGQLRTEGILDPEVVATFGFGRRICPGSDVGRAAYWLSAASILACFNISPTLDEHGKPEAPKIEFLGKEIISHPEPFRCCITPRSKEVIALIQAEYDEKSEYI